MLYQLVTLSICSRRSLRILKVHAPSQRPHHQKAHSGRQRSAIAKAHLRRLLAGLKREIEERIALIASRGLMVDADLQTEIRLRN